MPWLLPRALSDPTQLTHLTQTPSPAAPARSGLQRRCYRLPACLVWVPYLGLPSCAISYLLLATDYRLQTTAQVIREAKSNGRRRRRRQRESESETQAQAVD
jgi:hypothetical protein